MPELPEVETVCRGLRSQLVGQTVQHVQVRTPKLRVAIPPDLVQKLPGLRVHAVARRAKYGLIYFEKNAVLQEDALLFHLGMSGRWVFHAAPIAPAKHDHVVLRFASGLQLHYHDPRRFGFIEWALGGDYPAFAALGPEPLEEGFSAEYLYTLSRQRTTALKPFLMDGRTVVGVGNIYASEALFEAGLPPSLPAGRLTRAQCTALVAAVKEVLTRAIAAGGSSLRDYAQTDGTLGYFQHDFKVYGRAGQPCRTCSTPIAKTTQAQRSTFWCPVCQMGKI